MKYIVSLRISWTFIVTKSKRLKEAHDITFSYNGKYPSLEKGERGGFEGG
ncbi:MAG: hypothetical protein SCARUB_03469 [Candidatus Scalindua rubra]|uniref:Uncharacterized protein n=1 Tax=Candidatus Scalindua rubra TaxID=1872076 RepID=A0A1E3X719_9BACT|nr:MAG: hypothetical protein SCARUB_03469 [Candidatus Scalindua rubra]